jgi:hypothetical protein
MSTQNGRMRILGMMSKMISRLRSHVRRKKDLWTHFSAFEVWENIRNEEIVELEGLFRHLYRRDSRANALNKARRFKKMDKIKQQKFTNWLPISRAATKL